jgi:flagellar motor switch protein FliN
VETHTLAALTSARPLPWVLVDVPYARGLSGMHWLSLNVDEAVQFGEMLLGTHDEVMDLSEGHVAAIRDAMNQMLVSVGPALMPFFARSVAFGPTRVRVAEGTLPPELGSPSDRVSVVTACIHAERGPDTYVLLLTSEPLAAEIASAGSPSPAGATVSSPADTNGSPARLDLILDVTLPVTVELGRARMQIQEVLKLAPGSVIELDKSAGDPVELYINDRPIAKGEVVIIDENFGIRLTSIVTATERIKTLR